MSVNEDYQLLKNTGPGKLFFIFLAVVVWTISTFASASNYTGKIETFVCHTISPYCQIKVSGQTSGTTCATELHWPYVFDGTTAEGKSILSMLMSAQIADKRVVIGGLNTCLLNNASEDLRHVYILNN